MPEKRTSNSDGAADNGGNKKSKYEEESEENKEDETMEEDNDDDDDYEVIIIGAGAAGIGIATALRCGFMDTSKLLILEQGPSIGTSFREWHKYTSFISPSWPSFPYGSQDLNVVFPDASLGVAQHPTGDEYADYLEDQATNYTLNIKFHSTVTEIVRNEDTQRFAVTTKTTTTEEGEKETNTTTTTYKSSIVVWCGGEWSYPAIIPKECDKDCTVHYKDVDIDEIVKSVDNVGAEGEEEKKPVVVVGLGEAGADIAVALAERGIEHIVLVDGKDPEEGPSKDPSCRLSPKSVDGLNRHKAVIEVFEGKRCASVKQDKEKDVIEVELADINKKKTTNDDDNNNNENSSTVKLTTNAKVIMCIGFDVSQNPVIQDLFHWRDDGCPELDESCDESTKTTNLFVSGPMIRHSVKSCKLPTKNTDEDETNTNNNDECQTAVFCFVYKFRTRFPIVAEEIIQRIIHDRYNNDDGDGDNENALTREGQMWGAACETMREFYKSKGMYLSEITEACVSC